MWLENYIFLCFFPRSINTKRLHAYHLKNIPIQNVHLLDILRHLPPPMLHHSHRISGNPAVWISRMKKLNFLQMIFLIKNNIKNVQIKRFYVKMKAKVYSTMVIFRYPEFNLMLSRGRFLRTNWGHNQLLENEKRLRSVFSLFLVCFRCPWSCKKTILTLYSLQK